MFFATLIFPPRYLSPTLPVCTHIGPASFAMRSSPLSYRRRIVPYDSWIRFHDSDVNSPPLSQCVVTRISPSRYTSPILPACSHIDSASSVMQPLDIEYINMLRDNIPSWEDSIEVTKQLLCDESGSDSVRAKSWHAFLCHYSLVMIPWLSNVEYFPVAVAPSLRLVLIAETPGVKCGIDCPYCDELLAWKMGFFRKKSTQASEGLV